jgi:hypothetical protein
MTANLEPVVLHSPFGPCLSIHQQKTRPRPPADLSSTAEQARLNTGRQQLVLILCTHFWFSVRSSEQLEWTVPMQLPATRAEDLHCSLRTRVHVLNDGKQNYFQATGTRSTCYGLS